MMFPEKPNTQNASLIQGEFAVARLIVQPNGAITVWVPICPLCDRAHHHSLPLYAPDRGAVAHILTRNPAAAHRAEHCGKASVPGSRGYILTYDGAPALFAPRAKRFIAAWEAMDRLRLLGIKTSEEVMPITRVFPVHRGAERPEARIYSFPTAFFLMRRKFFLHHRCRDTGPGSAASRNLKPLRLPTLEELGNPDLTYHDEGGRPASGQDAAASPYPTSKGETPASEPRNQSKGARRNFLDI